MIAAGAPAPLNYVPEAYWEARAQRFAREGEGLAAVCSYGMPEFYNKVIDFCQRRALEPWLALRPGTRVLDVGCGVGRWSRLLAGRGAQVTGIDISPTMIGEAQRRTAHMGLQDRCRFATQNVTALDAGGRFDLVLAVTVLQHILEPIALRASFRRMVEHLAPGGRMVILEAAPTATAKHCDTSIFRARRRSEYLELFAESGLQLRAITGVDPAPFKYKLLPHLRRLPRQLAIAASTVATALSLPIDACFGRYAANRSWHAVFVLERAPAPDSTRRDLAEGDHAY
jgi:2-polyprenyl-3-methyl-5-hydroxy-6-metoxy-1,4-benzoquinol methylase